ncbi:MAG: alpha-2-macroglobulin family protein [Leptolyngbya sp. SIO1E4]|nr:alpha-2-macroglobulin family protein [Leptolyngbya sp. SIO1E4]
MFGVRRLRRLLMYGLMGLVLAVSLATCDRPESANQTEPSSELTPLAEVAELPDPELPEWIEEISPMGKANTLAQIRIRFTDPLVAVESLESPNRTDVLEKFEVFPEIPGQFRFLTPRMVGFQADRAIPKATRLRITLKSGLADLADHQLEEDLAWTFETEPIELTNLPGTERLLGSEENPMGLDPTLEFNANVPLDLSSLRQHLRLIPGGQATAEAQETSEEQAVPENQAEGVSVRVVEAVYDEDETDPSPQAQFGTAERPWKYHVTPEQPLEKGTRYFLAIAPGVRPAGGNLPTANSIDSQVMTYSSLAFKELELRESGGRFTNGWAQLNFNNGLMADSVDGQITVEPAPKEGMRLVRAYDNSSSVSINAWALEPNTTYTFTLGADLEDRFGQTLGEPVTAEYTTGDLNAEIWAPTGLNIFPASQDLQLNLSLVNLPDAAYRAAYKVVQPTELVNTDTAYPRSDRPSLLPDKGTWQSYPITAEKNELLDITVPLREQLGGTAGMLAYGVTARTTPYDDNGTQRWQNPEYYGLVQLTNLGVFAQWFPESGLVRVHHLSDGSVVSGSPVAIYRAYFDDETRPTGTPQPCATGTTDDTGTLRLASQALQTCMGGAESFGEPPELLVVAREGDDWAFVHTRFFSGDYGYGIYAGWNGAGPESRGTVFSDRFLYQPGETARLTGNAYYLQRGTLNQDANTAYTITVTDPEGTAIDLGTQTTNDFGTFSVSWDIPSDQPLGYYTIVAKAENGVELQGELRVAEFKLPNFQVDLTLDQDFAVAGESLETTVQSNYLFGAPVQGGDINYYVTREPTAIAPEGWDGFTFGPQWYWPEEKPTIPSDVLETSQTLGAQGQSELSVDIADDLPYPMTYRVDAEVVDVSNLSVADSKTVRVLPEDRVIGLKSDFVANAEQPFDVQVIVTDPEGQAQSGQSVQLVLERMEYSSVTEVIEGSATPNYQVEYEQVDDVSVRSGNEAQTVQLTAQEGGSYRIRATFSDSEARSPTDTRLWVTGDTPVYWGRRYNNDRLEVQLDKERYAPGETATALIQSPYEAGELYFAVVRNNTLYEQVVPVSGGAPQVQFTVTPEMLPNAAVEAVLVRQGDPVETLEPGNLEELVGVGFAPFEVDLADRYLTAEVTPSQAELPPATEQTVELTLKDNQGQPIQGQFTVMVVDEAVLQLSGHRPPDLVETVYAEQAIATRFADNRRNVVLQNLVSPLAKGWGFGGGFSAGGESTRIRQDFQALAYYNGSVLTNEQGTAQVSFTLPDNLTTWRVMVVATDGNLRFGNGEATFITTRPLITAPVLPQFARQGDRLMAGVSVTSTRDQRGRLRIQGDVAEGLTFTEAEGDTQTLTTRFREGTQVYRFPVEVTAAGEAQVRFQAQLGDNSDGFQLPIPVESLQITEQVVTAGTTLESLTIPLNVGEGVVSDVGGLDVSLSSTLLANIKAPVQQMDWTDALPNLSTAASQLTIAANLQLLSQRYGQVLDGFDAAAHANEAIQRMQTLRRPDGGLSAWPGSEQSDPLVTPYAAIALATAQSAGFSVDGAMISQLQSYLSAILTNPAHVDWCKSDSCKRQVRLESLLALAELGDVRQDFLTDLYEQREAFDTVGQLKLARYLSRFDNWQTEADALANQIQETVYETARSATVNLPTGWRWFHSPVVNQAQSLALFVARNSDAERLGRLVQGLLDLRRDGAWRTPYDNAQALSALVAYAGLLPEPPNFEVAVQLDGESLATQQFQGYQQPNVDLSVPMADLPQGESSLVLDKSAAGILHYLTTYRYRLQGDPPGRLQGLRVTRTVRPANGEEALYQMGLSPIEDAPTMDVGQVFDVGLEIITDHPVHHVIITDPLPAGLETVDTSFQTSTPYFQPQQDSWEIGYQQLGRDRIRAYANNFNAGVYSLHYLVRSVTPGTFLWPGAEVQLEYAPEEFGRSAATTLEIQE